MTPEEAAVTAILVSWFSTCIVMLVHVVREH